MNSEELEQSLKAEFESYLKGVLANMREDVTEFQIKIEAELEKHKSQLDEAFRGFSTRFDSAPEFDAGFKESVIEHLRLARDEGAKITATAIAEAEELDKATAPNTNLYDLKDAVNDISSKDSQSSILKSLIQHAEKYSPRGAFFIIKNEHFVGWKVFGKEAGQGEAAIRDVHFPVAADSILGAAVKALSTVEGPYGTHSENGAFLDPLQFGQPDRMYAIPLVARGRGVAVLYSDYGHEGVTVSTDALEMLVRVAGLTVELLASSKAAHAESHPQVADDLPEAQFDEQHQTAPAEIYEQPAVETSPMHPEFSEPQVVPAEEHSPFEEPVLEHSADEYDYESGFDMGAEYVPGESDSAVSTPPTFTTAEFESTLPVVNFDSDPESVAAPADVKDLSAELEALDSGAETVPVTDEHDAFGPPASDEPVVEAVPVNEPEMVFDSASPAEAHSFDASPFDRPAELLQPTGIPTGPIGAVAAPAVENVTARPAGSRLSDRHVDLPIEVAEDERRLHNDARRFARLLVSEIKLYNEKKVQEGREGNDLYERLREAIDRSREMYDKRVQTPVSSKFDYFHFELVNALADGDVNRLGPGYPGSAI